MTAIPQEERLNWIGASECAALFGVSPFTSLFRVWHEKAGSLKPDFSDNARMMAGRYLEPAIAAWAEEAFDWPLVKGTGTHPVWTGYTPHPTIDRMGASLDFQTVDGGEPVEIKNVDWLMFRDHWEADGDLILTAPIHYVIQVQHQLACLPGVARGWLLVCVGGNKLYRMEVQRHAGAIARIEDAVAEFWRTVDAGEEPKPDFMTDGSALSALYAAGDGAPIDLSGSNRLADLAAQYLRGTEAVQKGKKVAESALSEIKHMVGDHSSAIGPDGVRITTATIAAASYQTNRQAYRKWMVKQTKTPLEIPE